MVCDNDVQTQLLPLLHLGESTDAAVDGHYQANPHLSQALQGRGVQPVAFTEAVRDVMDNPASHSRDTLCQDNSTGNAVSIEVAIYGDELVSEQGAEDPGHGPVNVGEEEGRVGQPLVSNEEGLEPSRIHDSAIVEQLHK